MNKNLDLRYIFSYLGTLPYLILLIDKTFFNQIQINIINDFYIYYSLIIFVFIGAMNWSINDDTPNFIIVYGFSPSIIAVVIIYLQLYSFDYLNIIFFLITSIISQLILDFYLIYSQSKQKSFFVKLRIPLSVSICFFLLVNLTQF
jgi:hypothetical protein